MSGRPATGPKPFMDFVVSGLQRKAAEQDAARGPAATGTASTLMGAGADPVTGRERLIAGQGSTAKSLLGQ